MTWLSPNSMLPAKVALLSAANFNTCVLKSSLTSSIIKSVPLIPIAHFLAPGLSNFIFGVALSDICSLASGLVSLIPTFPAKVEFESPVTLNTLVLPVLASRIISPDEVEFIFAKTPKPSVLVFSNLPAQE